MKRNKKINILLIAIICVVILLIWIFVRSSQGIQEKELVTANCSIKYDSTWKVKQSNDNEVILQHNDTKSTIDISVAEIDADLYGKSIKQIAEIIKSQIKKDYNNYNCITEGTTNINESLGESYQMLFEDGKNQSLIVIGMHGYKLMISNYTAENKYFDILLDSAQNINSNIVVLDQHIDLMDTTDIKTTGLNIKDGSKEYNNVKTAKIYGTYYYVEYTIPAEFYNKYISTTFFGEGDNGKELTINSSIQNENIFEVFDELESSIKEANTAQNFEIEKVNKDDLQGYCYKYKSKNSESETYNYLYILDNYNTLCIKMSGESITKKLIDSIKITKHTRYGNYIDRTTQDGFYIGNLIAQDWFSSKKYQQINVSYKVPDKYTEIVEPTFDKGAPEQARSFIYGKLRNDEIEVSNWSTDPFYDYNITIAIEKGSIDSITNKSGSTAKYQNDITIEGITYKYFTDEYDSEGTKIHLGHLYTEINSDDSQKYCYHIQVSSLDNVQTTVLQDFAASTIKVESVE